MQHKPAPEIQKDASTAFKTRLGLSLFAVYGLVYASFVAINVINPKAMGQIVFDGLNLAVVYGFGLIILAIVMGLIYNAICTRAENRMNPADGEPSHDL